MAFFIIKALLLALVVSGVITLYAYLKNKK